MHKDQKAFEELDRRELLKGWKWWLSLAVIVAFSLREGRLILLPGW